MFYVAGEGLFPGVLDLCTFMSEKRACLLANKGFVVLAVAVFTDKPDNVKEMHLDHFKEAVDFLQQHPKVNFLSTFKYSCIKFQAFDLDTYW